MGEGWGDFYAHAMLSQASDPIDGVYALGGYALLNGFGVVGTGNYYYGIRRFPKAIMSSTGGPNNRPHNPLTFADVDSTQANTTNGAFPAMAGPHISSTADQVHAAGEVWSSALWEVRAKLVTRLGWAVGNRKVLQLVTDGMKLAPLGPTFLTERDAILAAAQASSLSPEAGADVADVWSGFAIRGIGFSSSIQNSGTGAGDARVTEAFDLPNLLQTPTFTVSDSSGDNDGFPEPGENITLTIPLTNTTGNAATGVTLTVVGGGTANYGTINNGATVSQNVSYTVPAATPCGSALTLTFNVNSSLGATSFTRSITVGVPTVTFAENFDGVTAPGLPAGWTVAQVSGGTNWVNTTNTPDTPPNVMYAADPTSVGGGTDLTSPLIPISSQAATVTFRHRFDSEAGWDGGLFEVSIGGNPFQDILVAGGSFVQNGYNSTLGVNTAGNSPFGGRQAWSGDSGGYITSVIRLPASANGQNVRLKWRFGADDNTTGNGPNPGWYVDTISVAGSYNCSVGPSTGHARADFDGDGKTDLSVFRPSNGNWYLFKSTAGVGIVNWGSATDTVTPGDFDGDGKTDTAVYRPSTGQWFILRSSNATVNIATFGIAGDKPVAGDYDGDSKTDIAVFRPSAGTWYAFRSSDNGVSITNWGAATDDLVPGDYDNDGKTDVAVYRPSTGQWFAFRSTAGPLVATWGVAGDKAVPADYDGDHKQDLAVYRPSTGSWYVFRSSDNSVSITNWGNSTDVPAPGDFDGDGKDDPAVYRNGQWFVFQSTGGPLIATWGAAGDVPVPARYIP